MIGETNAFNNTVQTEQIYRQNGGSEVTRQRALEEEASQQNSGQADTVALSPQALAQARNVAPAGDAAETDVVDQQGRGQEASPGERAVYQGSVDTYA